MKTAQILEKQETEIIKNQFSTLGKIALLRKIWDGETLCQQFKKVNTI